MARMTNADSLSSLNVDIQLPPIPKDMQGSDSSAPFSPQWLLPKLSDNKLGLEEREKCTDPLKSLGNTEDLCVSEKKKDIFRPSFYDAEKVRRECWTDEEREANSAIRRDLQKEGEELSDSRKLERRSNSSSRFSNESRHLPSDRWTGSGSREGPYEPRRESKWDTRWGPDDKESENWREKCAGRDCESPHNKGAPYQTIHLKDIKNQGKSTDKDGEHHSRSWRSSSAVNRGRGEASPYLPSTTNKPASMFSYGRGKGDSGSSVFSVDRGRVGHGNSISSGSIRQFPSGTAADKSIGSQRDPPSLRYSRMKLFDIYRMTDLKGYRKAFEGFQEFPSLIQTDHLVPLALTAPVTEELVIMEAIENGEILSSGVPQASKDGSSGNIFVVSGLSPLTKSGIGEETVPIVGGYRDDKTNNEKKDHSFHIECPVEDNCSQLFDSMVHLSENLGQHQEATLTAEAFKFGVTSNSTRDLGNMEVSKLESTVPCIYQSVGRRSLSSSNNPRDLAKNEPGSSDMGWLNKREEMGIEPSGRYADSSSYIGSNAQWQDPVNPPSDTRIESRIRKQPSNPIQQGHGDLFVLKEKLSDRKPQQYQSPEHLTLFYKDPQGQIQGPFSGCNLVEWFDAGYFGIDLLVRLANAPADAPFSILGDVIPQLRTRVRPPPGFSASRPKDIAEVSNRGKVGSAVGVRSGTTDLEPTKNGQILGNESKVEEENRFLESLMVGRINNSLPESHLSEGMQGYSGLAGGRTSLETEIVSDMKYMHQKMSLEQQHLLTSYQTGFNDPPASLSKVDVLREVPITPEFLPKTTDIPHQHLVLLSILQSATNKIAPPTINSSLPLWTNFPEVQVMKNTHGGIDITKDSLGLHPNQQSSQTRFGTLPNRLQTQFQPSLSNQTPFFGFSSGTVPQEKSVAPEFGQDLHMVNLLQQYMSAQNVHPQVPHATHLDQMELLLLLQRQKMEQQKQQQLLSHGFSGNHLHNHYDEQSFWRLNAEEVNVIAAMESPIQQMHEIARSNPINIFDSGDTLNLHDAQDINIASCTEQSTLNLLNQMTDFASHPSEVDVPPMLDVGATQISTTEQIVSTTNELAVSQEFPQNNEIVTVASSVSKGFDSADKDEVILDLEPSVSEVIDHTKNSLSAISKQTHCDKFRPKVIYDGELCEVKKTSEKKSRKHKNLQLLKAVPVQKSKPIFKAGVEKDISLEEAESQAEASEIALDKETKVDEVKVKDDEFVQLSSTNLTWKSSPGQKVKSLLEIQMEEQSKVANMPNNKPADISITSEQKYTVDSVHSDVQCDSLAQIISEDPGKHENPWNLRNRGQLHDVLAEEVLTKVSGVSNEEKFTHSPLFPAENEGDVDHDFIEAKDSRKSRKKAAKIKCVTTKSSLPSNSGGLPFSVSITEKSKATLQLLQSKELLPSPPSAPSLGDFVFWKGDQVSRVTPPVWSTDSVKIQKPAFLKDIFREQDKNTKSSRQQISIQSPTKVQPHKGNGGSSLGKVPAPPSKVQRNSPIQTGSLDSGHQKMGMGDDLFWGPLNENKQGISEKLRGGNSGKAAHGEGSSQKAPTAKPAEHSTATYSSSSVKQPLSKGNKDSESKRPDAVEFRNWCEGEWVRLTGTNDTSFLEFCLKQTAAEAEALLRENVSVLDNSKEFVDKFLNYKKFLSSEAIEAAFRGPRGSGISNNLEAEADDGADGSNDGKKKGRKGRKGKMVSPALLGFNVVSNRIMMGEIQMVED